MTNENLKQLYSDLQREYDLILDRRKVLTSQAQNLMSFAGIIQTVLVGLIVALVTNKDAQILMTESPNYSSFLTLAGIGFISYIFTVVFSLWHLENLNGVEFYKCEIEILKIRSMIFCNPR